MAKYYEDAKIKISNYTLELSLTYAANSDHKASAGPDSTVLKVLQLPGTSKSFRRY